MNIREKLIKELEEYFGDDKKRINHARKVLHFAEVLLEEEKGERHIIIPASILHDIGIFPSSLGLSRPSTRLALNVLPKYDTKSSKSVIPLNIIKSAFLADFGDM